MVEIIKKKIKHLKAMKFTVLAFAIILPVLSYFVVGDEKLVLAFFAVMVITEIFISSYLLNVIVKKLDEDNTSRK